MPKLIRKYTLVIITLASLAFLASIFTSHDKLIFLIKPTISFYDLVWTIPFGIVAFYLIVSIIICFIFVFKSNYVTPKLIVEHEIWFLTSLLTYMCYSIYTISFQINKLLTSNSYIDILFENKFFLVKRVWSYQELEEAALNVISSYKNIIFSEEELSKILVSNSIVDVISKTGELCRVKSEALSAENVLKPASLWDDFWCLISSNPFEAVITRLIITFSISLYKNYNDCTFVSELIKKPQNILESRIISLESVTSSLVKNRENMQGVREFIRQTKEAFTINVSAIHQLNDRVTNLYRYLNCKNNGLPFSPSLDIPTLDSDNLFGPSFNPNFPGLGQVLGGDPSIRQLAGEQLRVFFFE